MSDTIFALSSGALPSGVAVIRVSGGRSFEICRELTGSIPPLRAAALRSIRARNGDEIDTGLVVAFAAPHSFTGEDSVEFQIHGGRAVVRRLLDELQMFDGARHASAGEFTKRAFENGKIDIVEAEGLADLISAETEMQRRLAVEQSAGGLSSVYGAWARRISHARAMIEAEIDFADEDDVPGSVSIQIWKDMDALLVEVEEHLADAHVGEIIRDGVKVAIVGAPNVGKSTLINALCGRDVSIVTDIPGTTRDVIHVDLDIGGYAFQFFDTAGIRASLDPVEVEGVRRALLAVENADIILRLQDVADPGTKVSLPAHQARLIDVAAKIDLAPGTDTSGYDTAISARERTGLFQLTTLLHQVALSMTNGISLAIPSRMRHVGHLKSAAEELRLACARREFASELRAEHLRRAAAHLGRITGAVDVEALLDVIFSEFCIGK